MRGAGGIGWALATLCAGRAAAAVPIESGPRLLRPPALRSGIIPFHPGLGRFRHPFGIRPFTGGRPLGPHRPPFRLPPPDTFIAPEGPGAAPQVPASPETLPAFAHGFHISVTVGAGQTFDAPPRLDRFVEVGQALGRCFAPPSGVTWGSITLRVALKRDGSVFGLPQIPYSDAATADQKTDLAHSLLAGLKRCTPLPLSPSLGAAVAGEIFAIRFIHEDKR